MAKSKNTSFQSFTKRYKVLIVDPSTFEEKYALRLSKFKVLVVGLLLIIVGSVIATISIVYTPLRLLIPGTLTEEVQNQIVDNRVKLDSLTEQITIRDEYLSKIQTLIEGGVVEENDTGEEKDFTYIPPPQIQESDSSYDALISPDQYRLEIGQNSESNNISNIHFFNPIKGTIVQKYSPAQNHFAVDIVAQKGTSISSIHDGTVIFADWTMNTGYVIYLQHAYNIISVYKHCEQLLKTQGDHVNAGEAIAIVGNTGEVTTGPHLHFELWQNGVSIDPEQHISF